MTLCVVQLSSACPERAQKEYKQRHDGVARAGHIGVPNQSWGS